MRSELQKYLTQVYSTSKIGTPHSIVEGVHIRFELGGDEGFKLFRDGVEFKWWKDQRKMTKNDKIKKAEHYRKRILQATSRATTLFYETFDNIETEIWILIYEYKGGLFSQIDGNILELFSIHYSKKFYDREEEVESQMISTDENGIDTFDKTTARVIVGKIQVKDINAEKILNEIANNEMGFEPSICQDIYFLDPTTDRGFYMYDDRGCYVWSDKAVKIKYLYEKRNEWIVNYHREEIDRYFKNI